MINEPLNPVGGTQIPGSIAVSKEAKSPVGPKAPIDSFGTATVEKAGLINHDPSLAAKMVKGISDEAVAALRATEAVASVLTPVVLGPAGNVVPGTLRYVFDLDKPELDFWNFRTCRDPFRSSEPPLPSREGLETLDISGSSQFSRRGLEEIIRRIGQKSLVIVDLREESHGLVQGRPVSWEAYQNAGNVGETAEEIIADERGKLEEVLQKTGKTGVTTEEALCREKGVGYLRVPVTDMLHPEDRDVDQFIAFVRSLPKDTWIHFHCKAGKGRTTTFMAVYDCMRNAGKVSLDDIGRRQFRLGGMDLLTKRYKDPWQQKASDERAEFLKSFHAFCREAAQGSPLTWSEWKAQGRETVR